MEVGAAIRWLVGGLGPWGGREVPLLVMVGRVDVVVDGSSVDFEWGSARARDFELASLYPILACIQFGH